MKRSDTLIATWGGAGLLPKAPGTWGSLAALPCAFALQWLGGNMLLDLSALLLLLYAIPVCSRYAAQNGNDPGEVVVDEVVGQWVVLGLTPPDAFDYVAGFLLFRLFDILKPFPIGRIEHMSHAGRAIMLDDVAAGLYAALTLLMLRQFFL